jgi:hypothetical protein
MGKYEFKRTNQEAPRHYRPLAPAVGGSEGGTAQVLPPSPVRW